jgi:hypothetical protein
MHIDWLGYGGLVVGVLSLLVAFFAVTNRSVHELLVYWRIRRLPKTFTDIARDYRLADEIPDDPQGSSSKPPSYTRVQRKDILAEGLFRFAQGAAIGRRVLAGSQDHGYVVTLMKLIQAEPRRGDVSLIAKAVKCNVPPSY